ncbi:thiamine phosphate synthase [Chitinophaga sp. Cy-1792]|uniref:thiamine phosphate synthase n=1 Tax=Chitinophaga sp. Cy-1792 TaxID=2608339 RepID=UPI001424366E|nr:thiamine phosphate synthase [Chitinophaga sp. Cy-1792]
MIWVITSPENINSESELITNLLAAGADKILLRKPSWTSISYYRLLEKIPADLYKRIIIRDNQQVYKDFALAGIHWSEAARNASPLSATQKQYSTGVHDLQQLEIYEDAFSHFLLSPVFDSISKPGYSSQFAKPLPESCKATVLALGGINEHNIMQLPAWKYAGAAVLGSIWKNPAKAVDQFLLLQQAWHKAKIAHP